MAPKAKTKGGGEPGVRTDPAKRKPHRRRSAPVVGVDLPVTVADRSWEDAFIESLREDTNVRNACEAAGVGRQTAYDHKGAYADFRARWETAVEEGRDALRKMIRERAAGGSDRILELSAKLWLPEAKEKSANVNLNIDYSKLTDEQLARIAAGEDPVAVVGRG